MAQRGRLGEPWAKCQTCSLDFPASQVWYNPRFGWQCFRCWDGLVHRDQIEIPIFPYEGTRKTPAPVTNTLTEGVAATDSFRIYTLYDRAVPANKYDVTFGATRTIAASTGNLAAMGGIELPGGWIYYIKNAAEAIAQFRISNGIPWLGSGDLYVSGGVLQYTAYTQQTL